MTNTAMLVSAITRPLVVSLERLDLAVRRYQEGYLTVDGVPMTMTRLDSMLRNHPGEPVYLFRLDSLHDWVAVLTSHPCP